MNRPRDKGGSLISEESDAATIQFFGGKRSGTVAMSSTQVEALTKFYGTDHPRSGELDGLADAFSWSDTARAASEDGLRVMAFLAKHHFLEEGVDPVRSLARAIQQDLFQTSPDIWNEEEEEEDEE